MLLSEIGDKEIIDIQYPERDYHDMYVCEVKRIFK